MIDTYQSIDAEITLQCKKLEQQGIPLDLSELLLKIFRKNQELVRLKESMNQRFGIMPTFSDDAIWQRVYRYITGKDIYSRMSGPKISKSRKAVEDLKDECPELVDVYRGLCIEKSLSLMNKVAGSKVDIQGKHILKPHYKINTKSGQVLIRDPNLQPWDKELREVIREPGFIYLLVWYDALELAVLQDLSQDPVLGSDLESLDPYKTMACRFWETSTPSSEQEFITRIAFNLFCNGVKPINFYYCINTTYSDRCSLDPGESEKIYNKFIQHYTVSCEYFEKIAHTGVVYQSMFGRVGIGSKSRCYPMTSTTIDITKLGFLSVLEDSRLEKLGVTPLALVFNKMLISVPCGQDLDQVKGYILSDFDGAYPRYSFKTCITTGSSWGDCGQVDDLDQEEP